jgi:hypothetical protein
MSGMTGLDDPNAAQAYVEANYGDANSCMSAEDRAAHVMARINEQLAALGVPHVGYDWDAGNNAGQFNFDTWRMGLGRDAFDPIHYESGGPAAEADLLDTVYHEARHSEQWFRMARERAGLGASADQIVQVMGIPDWVAAYAVANPILQCDTSQYEAEQWYQSVYGAGAAHRNATLSDVGQHYQDYRNLPEEHDAWHAGGEVTQDYLDHPR